MAVRRTHRYTIDPTDLDELIAWRATLIAAIRAAHPGLAEARLTRLEDGTFTDVWRWLRRADAGGLADMARFPQARAAMSLTGTPPPSTARSSTSGNRASSRG